MNFDGFSLDKLKSFKDAKIKIRAFRKSKQKQQHDIPEWLLAFDKIHDKDKQIDEKRKLKS